MFNKIKFHHLMQLIAKKLSLLFEKGRHCSYNQGYASAHRLTYTFLVTMLVWAVPRDLPPDPVCYGMNAVLHNRVRAVGQEVRQARLCLNQLINLKPGCTACKKLVLILLNGVRKKDLESAWIVSVSANAVLLGKNQSEVGVWDAPRDAAAVLPIPEGSWTHTLPPGKSPQSALSSDLCNGLKNFLKAVTLLLHFCCPLPYKQIFAHKQMFALNRAAGRHLLQLKRDRTTVMIPACTKDTIGQLWH